MNILTIPLRNTRTKWLKTLLLMAVFSLGVMSIVSLNHVSRVVGDSLEKKLTAFGANILLTPRTEQLTVSYGGFSLGDLHFDVRYLDVAEVDARVGGIENKANVSAVAPKLVVMERVAGVGPDAGDAAVGVVGVRWESEKLLKGYWGVMGSYPERPDQVLLGGNVAAKLGLRTGSAFEIGGEAVTVSGVLAPTGSDDDNVILADLGFVQRAHGLEGKASFVEVAALCAGCPIEDMVHQIATALPGTDVKALQAIVKQRMFSVHFVKDLVLTVSLVILLTACAMVGLSMLNSVNERKKEIGILRSVGFAKSGIFAIFCLEALFIGLAAGAAGYVGAYFLSYKVLEALDVTGVTLAFDPAHLLLVCLGVGLVTVTAAFLPAWKAARTEPGEALISF